MAPPVRTATAEPVAHPPLRYSIEAEDAPPSQPASQSAPQTPRYSAGMPPASAPVQQVAVTQPAERTTVSRRRPGYRLGPGDKVHVTVYGEGDLSGDFEVSGSGRIAFPLIGDVTAAGLTAPGLGEDLTKKLAGGYLLNPRVSVEVVTYRPFYIIGEVNKPGSYPYTDGMTAMNAIGLGGGFTPRAEGRVPISFSGGIDAGNVHEGVACGFAPVTTCTDLLKPPGYRRLPRYLKRIEADMERLGARDLAGYAVARAAERGATAGAPAQRPRQGARTTRTPAPRRSGSLASSLPAPIIAQVTESHTLTVSAGGGVSPSSTMSKWA